MKLPPKHLKLGYDYGSLKLFEEKFGKSNKTGFKKAKHCLNI